MIAIRRKLLILSLCIMVMSSLATAQESYIPGYSDLWISNFSSYHIRVLVDGWEKGSVLSGATSRITVTSGYHEIYAEEYQNGETYWGPMEIYVPEEGYELTLYDPEPGDIGQENYVTKISNLYVINESPYDARVFVDGWEKGTVLAGGTFTTTIQGGFDYVFYAEDLSGEILWGPQTYYIPKGEDFTWTLEF